MEKKRTIIQAVICVGLVCLIWGGYFIARGKMDIDKVINKDVSRDYNLVTAVEKVLDSENKIKIFGWALRVGAKQSGVKVILSPLNSESEILATEAKKEERKDVLEYFSWEDSLGKIGYQAVFDKGKLNDNICYEIFLDVSYQVTANNVSDEKNMNEKSTKVSTNRYLYNGELYKFNPLTFVEPKMIDEKGKKIISEGKIIGFRS